MTAVIISDCVNKIPSLRDLSKISRGSGVETEGESQLFETAEKGGAGAHQMEPPSPIQALGVNPFPSRFIIRSVPRGDFAHRQWEEPITTTK